MKPDKIEYIQITERSKTDAQAVEGKMKALTYKLFGLFNPVPYELISMRKVFVPYELLVYSYRIGKGKRPGSTPGRFDKTGEIAIVFDNNEAHGFHFDLSEDLPLQKLLKANIDGEILPDQCTEDQVLQNTKDTIRFRYLSRGLGHVCELELTNRSKFYRPAWELTVSANGKQMQRFAYLDIYGSMNENISGLKVRLNI